MAGVESEHCVAHQPDAGRCQHAGCSKAAKGSSLKYCMAHGAASRRCAEQGCSWGAQEGRQHCSRHLLHGATSKTKWCQVPSDAPITLTSTLAFAPRCKLTVRAALGLVS